MPQEDIIAIIHDGVYAPSGENCQPWRFMVHGSMLSVFNVPEADMSLYNSHQRGSHIAHGALLENVVISASKLGYTTEITLFPSKDDDNHIANVTFKKDATIRKDELYDFIKTRCTNRKEYTGEKLTNLEKEALFKSIKQSPLASLTFIDDSTVLNKVGAALAVNERVLFENKYIHDFFYNHIIWDKNDETKSGGFFIDTLEFLPHQLQAVKLFKNWTILTILNKVLNVSKKISKENGAKYAASGTFGAIFIENPSRENYVQAGMALERMWLIATKLGLALHPCNGTIYFMDTISDMGGEEFSSVHKTLIKEAYSHIIEGFDNHTQKIAFVFRIGKAKPPTTTAKRSEPVVEFVV